MSASLEAEVLARCLQGRPEAWDELFDRHYAATGRFVFQLGHDFTREDVEEICQETFLTVIRSLHTFKGKSQFQTWLFRIASNKARDFNQRRRAAKRGGGQFLVPLHPDAAEEGPPVDPPSPLPGPDLSLIQAENIALVGRAIELLGGPCQEIIHLRYFAELSYEEIAAALELNLKTVSSRLSKCLGRLGQAAKSLLAQDENSREKESSSAV